MKWITNISMLSTYMRIAREVSKLFTTSVEILIKQLFTNFNSFTKCLNGFYDFSVGYNFII